MEKIKNIVKWILTICRIILRVFNCLKKNKNERA